MDMDEPSHAPANLAHALGVLRRRWLILLGVVVLLPAATYFFTNRQDPSYQGEASVQLSRQNLANSLTGTPDNSAFAADPQRLTTTQAKVARSPAVAARVVRRVPQAHLTVKQFLAASSVDTSTDSDVLTFKATNRRPELAQRLGLVFAQEFTSYRLLLDSRSLGRALGEARNSLRALRPSQEALRTQLEAKIEQLQTLEALQTSNASVVGSSVDAIQIAPRPLRNAVLALLIAIAGGIALAFLIDALDTRVRSVDSVAEALDAPLLARIPAPRGRIQRAHGLVVEADQASAASEALRALRTSLDYVVRQQGGSTLMVTSAVTAEG
jgi:capsular polysaccharide biosynthesis protein